MASLTTTHTPTSVSSSVTGSGGGGGDMLDAYLKKRMAELDKPKQIPGATMGPRPLRVARTSAGARQTGGGAGEGTVSSPGQNAVNARAAMDQYEMKMRAAARKPIAGFNYMGYDQGIENLPSSFRPEGASLQVSPAEIAAAERKARNDAVFDDLMQQSRQATRLPQGSRPAANARSEGVDPIRALTTGYF